jgi:hypothetical protein
MNNNSLFLIENDSANLIELDKPNVDTRGTIQSIINKLSSNVSIISSKKMSIRSNHFHLTDSHYMYTLSGTYFYFYKKSDNDGLLKRVTINKGALIYTPPLESHVTIFTEDTELLVISKNFRDQETYENDTRRVNLISEDQIMKYIA